MTLLQLRSVHSWDLGANARGARTTETTSLARLRNMQGPMETQVAHWCRQNAPSILLKGPGGDRSKKDNCKKHIDGEGEREEGV